MILLWDGNYYRKEENNVSKTTERIFMEYSL